MQAEHIKRLSIKDNLAWWIIGLVASPFVLFMLITLLLYLPPVQRWAVGIVTCYASEKTDMMISIDDVRLRFPLDLQLDGIKTFKQNDSLPQVRDTVLMAEHAICSVELKPLFGSRVEVNLLQLDSVKLNTTEFISDCRVKGSIGQLIVESHDIDLNVDTLLINSAMLDRAHLDIELADTAAEDTTTSQTRWRISVSDLAIKHSAVAVHLPLVHDSITGHVSSATTITTAIDDLRAKDGFLDLENNIYDIRQFHLYGAAITYGDRFQPRVAGLDFNHIDISELNTSIDSLHYSDNDIRLALREFNAMEQSGLKVITLTGHVMIDSTSIHLPDLVAQTANSHLRAAVDMDFDAFAGKAPGQLKANVDASLGKQDIMLFSGTMPQTLVRRWPNSPLTVAGALKGNMDRCTLSGVTVAIPSCFRIHLNGNAANLANPEKLTAKVNIDANARNIAFLTGMLPTSVTRTVTIPSGITARGDLTISHGSVYDVDMLVTEGSGRLAAKGHIDTKVMAYNASVIASALNIGHFVKGIKASAFSGRIKASGQGTDIFSHSTAATAYATIDRFTYDTYNLSGSKATLNLSKGVCHALVDAHNNLIDGTIDLHALMQSRRAHATMTANISNADLYGMKITDIPMKIGVNAQLAFNTDLKENYKVNGTLADIYITDSIKTRHPDDMSIDLLTRRDTTYAIANCGDLHLNAYASSGYKALMAVTDRIGKEVDRQFTQRVIDESEMRAKLPDAHIYFTMGTENPVGRVLDFYGYSFDNLYVDVSSSPQHGINGIILCDTLKAGDIQIDKAELVVRSDEETLKYSLRVENGTGNPQYAFKARLEGLLEENGTRAHLAIDNDRNLRGIDVSLAARMSDDGIRLNIDGKDAILGFKSFTVNEDNYLTLSRDSRVSANMVLKSADGTGFHLYTDDDNKDALQDITLSINNIDLSSITDVVPYMPDISGAMDGDFHFIMAVDKTFTLANSIDFKDLTYEGCKMGNIGLEFVYIPQGSDMHTVDGILKKDDNDIALIKGSYDTKSNALDVTADLTDLPLNLVNGFVPDQIIGLEGTASGSLTVVNSSGNLNINGTLTQKNGSLFSIPYGVSLAMEDKPIRIVGSNILFEDFKMHATNDNPVTINGSCDFSDTNHINMKIHFAGNDLLLIDAKETRRSEAYGKGYVNIFGGVSGELDDMKVRGRIEVLSKTNLYYILRNSPISTDNRMKELISFTDFSQEQTVQIAKPKPAGIDIGMNIVVNDGSHIVCWLNQNHTNYLDIIGSGDLRFNYAKEKIKMTGRYTISHGEMKYSLPVIPLKTFNISSDSYIEFTGDVMNPTLAITATEAHRASVLIDEKNRNVDFTCGVVLSKTLNDMGLEFTIDAPNDQDVKNQLATLSKEDRYQLAVGMLTTGMYMNTSTNSSNITMNSALTSFLQQEISSIACSALKTLDVQLGLENNIQANGSITTDYAFKFAKHFWNNRLSISIGGRISTGKQSEGKTASFFDNVELSYRMADNSNQFVGAFYKHDVYDYLEGYVDQFGGSYTWKRKLQRLKEIFPWVKTQNDIIPATTAKPDTVKGNRVSKE